MKRATYCMTCDGSGQDGDAGHSWEFVACRDCDGTGNNLMCLDCSDARAVCDDQCVACYVEFLRENPDDYDPTEGVWRKPFWCDVAAQFEATREWACYRAHRLAMVEVAA